LHWLAPTTNLLGYIIYKNGDFYDMVGATDSTLYHDPSVITGLTTYVLTTLYEAGESPFSDAVTISPIVGNNDPANSIPSSTRLTSIYPNPFNPETHFAYQIKEKTAIEINIYNVRGERIRSLFQGERAAGNYTATWQGIDDSGHAVSSGIYFVRFSSKDHHDMRKIILLK
jgi:hypothetical protein